MDIKRFLIFGFLAILILALGALTFWLSFKKTTSLDEGNKKAKVQATKTQTQSNKPLYSFAVFGDTEIKSADDTAPTMQAIIDKINEDDEIVFTIHTGDMTAAGTKIQFVRFNEILEKLEVSLYPTLGNNDIASNKYGKNFENYFGKSYYSFDFDDCHFVILDNASASAGFDKKQRNWLKEELEGNSNKRIFLVMHRPINVPLAGAVVEGGNELSTSNINAFLETIMPFSDKIEKIFTGHIHTYMEYTLADKIPVVVSGGGGAAPQLDIIKQDFHYLKVQVFTDKVEVEKVNI